MGRRKQRIVRAVKFPQPLAGPRAVLTDDFVRRLAGASAAVKRVFGDREQDIEWVQMGGRLYIVQARPYSVKADGL